MTSSNSGTRLFHLQNQTMVCASGSRSMASIALSFSKVRSHGFSEIDVWTSVETDIVILVY